MFKKIKMFKKNKFVLISRKLKMQSSEKLTTLYVWNLQKKIFKVFFSSTKSFSQNFFTQWLKFWSKR
jgi:hypothetical protein